MPIPDSCRAQCSLEVCELGESYLTEDEEAAADDEIRCDRKNTDALRDCAKLHASCGHALEEQRKIQR